MLIQKRALSPRWTPGSSFRPHPDKVSISPCAEQQGCAKKNMKRGKSIFSRVSAAGSPAPKPRGREQTHRWDLLYQTKSDKCSKCNNSRRTEESSPPESPLTASECAYCCPCFLSFCYSVFYAVRFSAVGDWGEDQSDLQISEKLYFILYFLNIKTPLRWLDLEDLDLIYDLDYWEQTYKIKARGTKTRPEIQGGWGLGQIDQKCWEAGFLN